ncbi:MAG TPA: alpha-hydroxy acid oxidase [Ktedonobacterales bacterium]|jgi:isopentenyl diphosphate isomerase/L-lactate dehydrogenase-like FMN-dependent dehydrogenase
MAPINVYDYEQLAQARLTPRTWAYYSGGAGDEITLRANRDAFDRLRLLPRLLRDVSACDTRARVLGTDVRMPILVAPTAAHGLAHAEGECATARAAGAVGTIMAVSTESTRTLEDVAAAATGPLWFQLYVYRDRDIAADLVRRAERAGYRAIVLTVDLPRWWGIERERRLAPDVPEAPRAWDVGNLPPGTDMTAAALTWDDIAWLRGLTALPIVVKGVLTPADAREAAARGATAIVVSNHGGRSLDTVPASIEALAAVARAVAETSGDACEVYLDGGVRRGTDVLKAVALGARAVLVGRPVLWGLAVDGADGARHVLDLLRDELELAMVLAGRASIADIDPAVLARP